MNEEGNSYLGFGFFFLLILGIVCGGSFLVYRNYKEKTENKVVVLENEEKVSDKLKKEQSKDFVYYQEEVSISESLSLVYKYPVINLESEDALTVTNELKNIVNEKKASVEKISMDVNSACSENVDGIKKAPVLDFGIYTFKEYVTLILYESMYSCDTGISSILKMRSYTFNVLTGKMLSASDLLTLYETTLTKGLIKIREELNKNQSIDANIKVEETMNNLKENETYILYISEEGELILKYIVKTNTVDYNDNISLK